MKASVSRLTLGVVRVLPQPQAHVARWEPHRRVDGPTGVTRQGSTSTTAAAGRRWACCSARTRAHSAAWPPTRTASSKASKAKPRRKTRREGGSSSLRPATHGEASPLWLWPGSHPPWAMAGSNSETPSSISSRSP